MSDYHLIVWTLYWFSAIAISLYWGWHGYLSISYWCSGKKHCIADKKTIESKSGNKAITTYQDCGDCELYGFGPKTQKHIKCSYAVSDFLSSMIGFVALYFLLKSYSAPEDFKSFSSFHIFLGIVAILGITGFGYNFIEVFKKFFKKL